MSAIAAENEIGQSESDWFAFWRRLRDDRAGRAELARCGTVTEAAFCQAFHVLRAIKGNPSSDFDLRRIGLIAAVLAHVETDDPTRSFAELMAAPDGDKPVVSDTRFRQLLRMDAVAFDDRLAAIVRVLRQLRGRAPVHRLAEDLWWWNERTKRRWALEYYELSLPQSQAED